MKSQSTDNPVSNVGIMKYPLTIPHSFPTPDEFMAKTNKAILIHHLNDDCGLPNLPIIMIDVYHIEDGNAVVHSFTAAPAIFKYI